ncbi:hypothetical protein NBRC3299_0537 [Acetobacter pasteurianus NBRC 3299]|nr:hypothetical protein NBRC3299_0537 [Acetobacter pasteurianus NBRC 3299]
MSGTVTTKTPDWATRDVEVTFRLLNGVFGTADGVDTVTLSGLQVQADIAQAPYPTGETAQIRITGMPPDLMNRLSLSAPDPASQSASEVLLMVPDGTSGAQALVFQGGVTLAYADYSAAPDVAFVVQAFSTVLPNALPAAPTGFKGAVPLAQVLARIAALAGLTFENNGLNTVLHDPYFHGTPGQQISQCLNTQFFQAALGRGRLAAWPATTGGANTTLKTSAAIQVSASTGLVGYPTWSAGGVALSMLFNPRISYGSVLALQSQYQPGGGGTGLWQVLQLRHSLSAQMPDGPWFTHVVAQAVGSENS